MSLVIGLIVLVLALFAFHAFSRADPRQVARALKAIGGIGAIGGAVFLGMRGQLGLAIPLGVAGLGLLGWLPMGWNTWARRTQRSTGQVSRVRSAYFEMELDHDTGAMRGRILAGRYEGVTLDALDLPTLLTLFPDLDDESRALLTAYLDRRHPTWREHAQGDAAAGQGGTPRSSGPMTQEEAYQILGLQPGASVEDIGRAHRTLMKKLHPDQGGSTYLAARVNEAKDILLRRHR